MAANGQLPLTALKSVQTGIRLPTQAANQWIAMVNEVQATHGFLLRVTYNSNWPTPPAWIGGLGGYRTLECQQWMWDNKGSNRCARPGYSVHGTTPGCVDISNWAVLGKVRMDAIAARYGFVANTVANEPWHYQYDGTTTAGGDVVPFPDEEEDDMPFYELINGPDGTVWWVVDRVTRYAIPAPANLKTYQAFLRDLGKSDAIVNKNATDLLAYGTPVYSDPLGLTAAKVDGAISDEEILAAIKALPAGGGTVDLQPVLDAIAKVPEATRAILAKALTSP